MFNKKMICSFILASFISSISANKNNIEDSQLYYGRYSENFIIRWGYQNFCTHVHDKRKKWATKKWPGVTFDPCNVKAGDILFIRDVLHFFNKMLPKIKHPFVMVTGGEMFDKVTIEQMAYLSNEKIIAWFSIHPCSISHSKFYPLPLGILQEPEYYLNRKKLSEQFAKLRARKKEKLLLMNFTGGDKPPYRGGNRKYIYELFSDKKFCSVAEPKLFLNYLDEMADYKFVLSPAGNAPDAYRTWEALLVGAIPIVPSSQLNPLYYELPVLVVEKWDQITEEFLNKKYDEITNHKYNIEKLFTEYWLEKIIKIRDDYLKN